MICLPQEPHLENPGHWPVLQDAGGQDGGGGRGGGGGGGEQGGLRSVQLWLRPQEEQQARDTQTQLH